MSQLPTHTDPVTTPPPRRMNTTAIVVAILLAGVVAGGIIGAVAYLGRSNGKPAQTAQATTAAAPNTTAAPATSAAAEPQTADAAKATAQLAFDRLSGGDYAGSWELFSAAYHKAISQADYAKLKTACQRQGIAIEVTSARLQGADRAVITWKAMGVADSEPMVYEAGRWRVDIKPDTAKEYTKGVDKVIADRKAAGSCG